MVLLGYDALVGLCYHNSRGYDPINRFRGPLLRGCLLRRHLQVVFKPNDNKGILSEKLFQFPIRGGGGRGEDGVVIGQMKGNAEC